MLGLHGSRISAKVQATGPGRYFLPARTAQIGRAEDTILPLTWGMRLLQEAVRVAADRVPHRRRFKSLSMTMTATFGFGARRTRSRSSGSAPSRLQHAPLRLRLAV
jgi:hypothetical protein